MLSSEALASETGGPRPHF